MEKGFFESTKLFAIGIYQRWYCWLIPFMLQALDIYEKFLLPTKSSGEKMTSFPSQWVFAALALSFFLAAIMTYHELRMEKEVLLSSQGARQRRKEIVDLVTDLLIVGKDLANRNIQSDEEYQQWEEEVEEWTFKSVAELDKKVSRAYAIKIDTIKAKIGSWVRRFNDEHNRKLSFLSARIDILEEIVERYHDIDS